MPPAEGLSQNMVDRILAFRLSTKHQRSAKADFFELVGGDIMP
jgi:hypothetical protein